MHPFLRFIKKHAVLVTVTLCLLILIVLFHELVTPFIIALIIVYLIEPMVNNMNKIHIGKRHLPRGVAVLCAYLLFLLAVVGVGFAFVPALTSEISQATEELPKYYSRIKDEEIPKLSQKADELLFRFSRHDPSELPAAIEETTNHVHQSIDSAFAEVDELALPEIDTSGSKPLLVNAERSEKAKPKIITKSDIPKSPVILRLHQTQKGDFDILAGDRELVLQSDSNGSYIIKTNPDEAGVKSSKSFNLEREINKTVVSAVESSTQYAGSALSILQSVIEVVVNTFVQFILVLMLAAFISIDTPKLMAFIRRLFEDKNQKADTYDEFKGRLSKGLAGVVRGQLIICCIDGFLTGLGLFLIGVDFALLLGIVGGLLCIIPIFGTIILLIPAVLLALMKGPVTALLVIVVILLIHFCDTNFFTPKIVGKSSNLHPVIIIFALLAGQQLAGVLGLILAVPVTSMLQTTIKFILEKSRENDDEEDEKKAKNAEKMELAYAAAQAAVQVMTSPEGNRISIAAAPAIKPASADLKTISKSDTPALDERQIMKSLKSIETEHLAASPKSALEAVQHYTPSPTSHDEHVVKLSDEPVVPAPDKAVISSIDEMATASSPSLPVVDDKLPLVTKMSPSAQISLDELASIEKFSNRTAEGDVDDTLIMSDVQPPAGIVTQPADNPETALDASSAHKSRSILIHKGAK